MPRSTPLRPVRAFTLIELLVVISIIALLVSILLPALGGARGSAESIQCQANQRQFGNSYNFYAQDFNDYYLGGWSSTSNASWEQVHGQRGYLGAERLDVVMLTTSGPTITGYIRTWDILLCPSEYGSPDPALKGFRLWNFVGMGRSYKANWYLTGYAYAVPRPGWSRGPTAAAYKNKLSETDIIMDATDSGMSWDLGYYEWGIDTKNSRTEYAFRHVGNSANQLFWDGHVENRPPYWISGISNYSALRDGAPGSGPDSIYGY